MKDDDRNLTLHEGAQRLGVSPYTLQRWAHQGRVGFLKLGRSVRFKLSDLEEFERQSRVEAQAAR